MTMNLNTMMIEKSKAYPPLYLDEWIKKKINSHEQKLTRAALEAYQLQKLSDTLRLAMCNSRFYKEKLKGLDLKAFKTLDRIECLPFTTVKELSVHSEDMICVSKGEISRIVSLYTSGTTGPQKRVYFTEEDQELTIDYFHHGMQNLVDRNDRVLILLPCKSPGSVGDLLRSGLTRLGVHSVPYGIMDGPLEVLKAIKSGGITSIVGNPDQILCAACKDRSLKEDDETIYGGTIKSVLLTTDYVSRITCEILEKIWNCKAYEHYGMTEMGLGCAVSCHMRDGYHPREGDLYIEIIDPDTGKALPDGETGEIVFTTLTRKAMPFIRYRTGDISRFLTSPCSCGSILKRLEKVQKRALKKSFV